jgi:AraC-like DNA-binding protein
MEVTETAHADTVSGLLRSLHVHSSVFCFADLREPWGVTVPAQAVAPFHLVVDGGGVLEADGERTSLRAGDFVILPHGSAHTVRHSLGAPVVPIEQLDQQGLMVRVGGSGARTQLICGVFTFGGAHPVVDALPLVLHVHGRSGRPVEWLAATLDLLRAELNAPTPGAQAIIGRVADVLVAQAIRGFLVDADGEKPLRALADPAVARAVRLVHAQPEHPWSVAELARTVAISRSELAARFRELTGDPPMRYIARCRLARAAELLRDGNDAGIYDVARQCGYASEVGFSRAFKRWFGMPPGEYRRRGA